MKEILIILFSIFFTFGSSFSAQEEEIITCASCDTTQTPQYLLGVGGYYITAKDSVHALAVFVDFPDDAYSTSSPFWVKGQAPSILNTFFDSQNTYPTGNFNISNYFREMSITAPNPDNSFHLTGDGVYIQASHTRQWYADRGKDVSDINKDILLKLDSANFDFSKYDKWDFGTSQSAHVKSADSFIDMVFMIYRNIYRDDDSYKNSLVPTIGNKNWNGVAGLLFSGNLSLPNASMYAKGAYMWNGSSGITMVRYPFYFLTEGNRGLAIFIHEFGHFFNLFHQYNSGTAAIMGGSNQASFTAHPYERERLNWITYTEVTTNQFITLSDYVQTGEAIKLDIGSGRKIYITNHQTNSKFDIPSGNYDAPGLYVTETISGIIRTISAKGNYDWSFQGLVQNPWDVTGNMIPSWKRTQENRLGTGFLDRQYYSGNSGFQHVYYDDNGVFQTNIHRVFGVNEDSFNETDRNVLSSFSNPSTLAYGGDSTYISIKVVGKAGSAYQIQVYVDSTSTVGQLAPFRPQNLHVAWSGTHPQLTWDSNLEPDMTNISSPGQYKIYQKIEGYTGWALAATVNHASGSTQSWIDTQVDKPGKFDPVYTYSYYVVAVDNTAKESVKSISRSIDGTGLMWKMNDFESEHTIIPSRISIKNYPNPFNPQSKITFNLIEQSFVTLKVFDIEGKEVSVLVDNIKDSGTHTSIFNGENFSSGIYIYRFTVKGMETNRFFTDTKRMVLIK